MLRNNTVFENIQMDDRVCIYTECCNEKEGHDDILVSLAKHFNQLAGHKVVLLFAVLNPQLSNRSTY